MEAKVLEAEVLEADVLEAEVLEGRNCLHENFRVPPELDLSHNTQREPEKLKAEIGLLSTRNLVLVNINRLFYFLNPSINSALFTFTQNLIKLTSKCIPFTGGRKLPSGEEDETSRG